MPSSGRMLRPGLAGGAMTARRERMAGVAYAIAAFGSWALNPLYFKAVAHIPVFEVLAHRIIWSMVILVGLVWLRRRWRVILHALADRRTLAYLALSTLIISANWLTYIWAIVSGRVLESSLGYYINPLVSVVLGVVLLRERLGRWQVAAVAIATLGVLILSLRADGFPWIAVSLALTFGFYGLIRKTARIEAVDGLLVETTFLLPVSLGYLLWLGASGTGAFGAIDPATDLLLAACGVVSAAPLIWFTCAARRLNLSTIGFCQYIAPTGHFLLAVFLFDEPFTAGHMAAFALIWTALAIFTAQSAHRARRTAPTDPGE